MNWYRIIERIKHPDRFQYAVSVVLQHEGGYSNDANDSGGETNFGISQKFLNDNKLNYTPKDISQELAKSIYKKFFWDKYGYNELKGLRIATKVFDLAVNCGPHEATLILQRAINNLSPNAVHVDGDLGQNTLLEANDCNDSRLLDSIRHEATIFYLNLINEHPEYKSFGKGWLSRASS